MWCIFKEVYIDGNKTCTYNNIMYTDTSAKCAARGMEQLLLDMCQQVQTQFQKKRGVSVKVLKVLKPQIFDMELTPIPPFILFNSSCSWCIQYSSLHPSLPPLLHVSSVWPPITLTFKNVLKLYTEHFRKSWVTTATRQIVTVLLFFLQDD